MAGSTPLDRIFHSLLGRVFIAVLQTLLTSVILMMTVFFWPSYEVQLLKYILLIGIGLIAGLSARRFLRKNTIILKHLVALGSTALSLAVLFLLSRGFLGINIYYQIGNPDWEGLIQYLITALNSALVITAFPSSPAVEVLPTPAPPREISRPGINLQLPKLSRPASKRAKKSNVKTAAPRKLSLAPTVKPEVKKPTRVKKKRTRKRPIKTEEIKFMGTMEHTCPYCLDPVEPNDPRGVKVCPICKTHHHADCWGITGACQIPHSQE
jgi:hypothetical protein